MDAIPLHEAKRRQRQSNAAKGALRLMYLCEIKPNISANFLIKGLLGAGQFTVLYGASNTGKTFVALYLAMAVALGIDVFGRRCRQGAVVYLACEGGHGISNRIAAYRQHHGIPDDAPFAVIPCAADLRSSSADTSELIALIRAAAEQMGVPVALVVVDTVSRAMAGGDENSSADMGGFVKNCDHLRQETGAHLICIHHSGKDESKGARGHSLLRAAVDTELEVTRDAASKISIMRVAKQRDLPGDGEFAFSLSVVELGIDEDGDAVTSCVVKPTDAPENTSRRLSPSSKTAMDALEKSVLDHGSAPPHNANIPRYTKAVREQQWRDYCYKSAVSGSDKQDAKQKAFKRAADDLQKLGMIGIWDGWVWIARHPGQTGQTRTGPELSPDGHGQPPKGCPVSGCPSGISGADLDALATEGL